MCTCRKSPITYGKRSAWAEHLFAWAWSHATTPLEKAYGRIKNNLFAGLEGDVVELGPGAGINFRHLPKGVRVRGVEPNVFMHPYLEEAAAEAGIAFELDSGHAEEIGLPDNSVDAVVSTLVLCSVFQPEVVLREIHRVLKPGGRFIFIEHIAAPRGTWMRWWQDFLQPLWTKVGDGCNPNRETGPLIEAAGFSKVNIEPRNIANPFIIVTPHIVGWAEK